MDQFRFFSCVNLSQIPPLADSVSLCNGYNSICKASSLFTPKALVAYFLAGSTLRHYSYHFWDVWDFVSGAIPTVNHGMARFTDYWFSVCSVHTTQIILICSGTNDICFWWYIWAVWVQGPKLFYRAKRVYSFLPAPRPHGLKHCLTRPAGYSIS